MTQKIALEEHFLAPGFDDYWNPTVADVPAAVRQRLHGALTDFGGQRLEIMDQAGIRWSVLSLSGPGVQVEPDTATAIRRARQANDFLAREVSKQPTRFAGFAHLPMQDGKAAADELERCVRDLGFKGALINGQTNGRHLDHPDLFPFWERVEALGSLVYLHPGDPVQPFATLEGVYGLKRATWEWTVETGSHALRIVFSGLFDRYPGAKLVLGHLGETLPYLLWRLDSRAKLYNVPLKRPPSAYIRENLLVTCSGMYSREPLVCALEALGDSRVMFSADYPFESAIEAARFMDDVAMDEGLRTKVAYGNAATLLGL
ncbi:MAG TPA: amidohydrolase family protein [Stellaceae bacterium]|jgi:2,3-dihydroxybenzoate decarboxylase|nr:amidohydrolase family protein [Stellaceae bacterium]